MNWPKRECQSTNTEQQRIIGPERDALHPKDWQFAVKVAIATGLAPLFRAVPSLSLGRSPVERRCHLALVPFRIAEIVK
jgi:hypothetical protein